MKLHLKIIILLALSIIFTSCTKPNTSNQITDKQFESKEIKPVRSNIVKKNQIKRGETLSSILNTITIPRKELHSIINSFDKIYSVRRLRPGKKYEIETDSLGNFISFTYIPDIEKQYKVFIDEAGNTSTDITNIKLIKKIKYLSGNIRTSLYTAIIEKGEKPDLLLAFTDIFQWDIDFFIDPRVGDCFKIVYEKYFHPDNDEFVKYGKILTAQYVLDNDSLTAIYFDNSPDDDGYYDMQGKSFQKTFLKSPLNYRRISSYFSYSRKHPILKIRRPHYGVDYAAPTGTPVCAAANGIVIKKGYDRGIGNYVKIRHKNSRFVTLYGHLSRFQKGIKKGSKVTQKQIIGFVGKTGLATGPHLHYSFYDNNRPIDPLKVKNTSGDPILLENKKKFRLTKLSMLYKLDKIDQFDLPLTLFTSSFVHFNRYSIPSK